MFRGFPERLLKEVKDKSKTSVKVKVCAVDERKYSVWLGGSVLASVGNFKQLVLRVIPHAVIKGGRNRIFTLI